MTGGSDDVDAGEKGKVRVREEIGRWGGHGIDMSGYWIWTMSATGAEYERF